MANRQVVIVGAGIVGLSIAYSLLREGAQVTVIDRSPTGDKASFGNAGAIAVTEVIPAARPGIWWRVPRWLLDPLGPLSVRPLHAARLVPWLVRFAKSGRPAEVARISKALAAINGRVYDDLLPMLDSVGMRDALRAKGAISVYATESGFQQDSTDWEHRRKLGILAEDMGGSEARKLVPALSSRVHRAVFTPQWSYVSDPKRIADGLRDWLAKRGVAIRTAEVLDIKKTQGGQLALELGDGSSAITEMVVVAAGAWSALLAKRIGDRIRLESERGYNTTLPNPGVTLDHQLIFPEGSFVATPLECGLRIGGAAEFGGLKAKADYRRSSALLSLARKFLPELQTTAGTVWAGHRPATPDSLPVIGSSAFCDNVFYAFGHGHLGLTQAATTGRLISDLIYKRPAVVDLKPYSVERFS